MEQATAVAKVAEKVGDKGALQQMLEAMKASIAQVLPKHLTPERVLKIVAVAASRQPELYECTKASLAVAIITASELGLDCSGTLGQGYLVPFWNNKTTPSQREVQFIPGYRGLIDLARRSGAIDTIEARVVYENDHFSLDYAADPQISHRPLLRGECGAMIGAYALAKVTGQARPQVEWMRKGEIDKIKARSKSKGGPWITDYEEMAKKTVARRLMKYLPLSPEKAGLVEKALHADNAQYGPSSSRPPQADLSGFAADLAPPDPAPATDPKTPDLVVKPDAKPEAEIVDEPLDAEVEPDAVEAEQPAEQEFDGAEARVAAFTILLPFAMKSAEKGKSAKFVENQLRTALESQSVYEVCGAAGFGSAANFERAMVAELAKGEEVAK